MNITVRIPDDLAARLAEAGGDLERQALEGIAMEAFRAGRLTTFEVRQVLGFETRSELDAFLKQRGVGDPVGIDDIERDLADLRAWTRS